MAQVAFARPTDSHESARKRLRDLIEERCYKKGSFKLASGRWSDYYFNLKPAMLDPEGINLLADLVLEEIKRTDAKFIGGLAMGAVPIAVAVVQKSLGPNSLQAFWVRPKAKDHGINNLTDGYLVTGSKVVIVDDVTTTGDSVMQAIDEVRRHGCEIVAVITVVDREEGAKERLAEVGLDLIPLYTTRDFDPDFRPT